MPDPNEPLVQKEDPQGIDPKPDPWGSATANTLQKGSAATGGTGAALLIGDQIAGNEAGSLALIPDPAQVFASLAQILGFQVDRSGALWMLGLVLVVLSVLLNVYSLYLRYQYADKVLGEWEAREAARKEAAEKEKKAIKQAKAQGFIGGDA